MNPQASKPPVIERRQLCEWYQTSSGLVLGNLEAEYLNKTIAISFNHRVLQIGSLGWEDKFVDNEFFNRYTVVDLEDCAADGLPFVTASCDQLPVASESVDTIIIPHSIEFAADQHSVLREAERVLKPEGKLILLGFNPWSIHSVYHYIHGKRGRVPWCGNFLRRQRMRDWLSLLNFEISVATGFNLKSANIVSDVLERPGPQCMTIAYAIRAIKRRYTLIPLEPAAAIRPGLVAIDGIETRWRANG